MSSCPAAAWGRRACCTSYIGSPRLPPARGEKTTRRVKRCNAPAGRKMIKMSCSGLLEHGEVRESREKFSPVACPLAGTGREATHNSRWYMRKRASITHSISRGLMAIALHLILIIFLCRRLLQNRQPDCSTIQQERQPRKRRHTPRIVPGHAASHLLRKNPRASGAL